MAFDSIFQQLLARVPGALGGMFLDWEGEAVSIVSHHFSRYDMQVIGAYEGIFLDKARRICSDLQLGAPQRFTITCEHSILLNWALKDGYYLVLVLAEGAPEGIAWHHLEATRDRLMEEL